MTYLFDRFIGAANVCNVFLMRQNELIEGIDVEDKDGNVVGSSKIAAWKVNLVKL